MKLFVRMALALGIIGSTFLAPNLTGTMIAQALPQEQVMQKLQLVPVFTIGSAERQLLTATIPAQDNSGTKISVSRIFINQQDAEAFLTQVRGQNAELGRTMQVIPLPLSEIYRLYEANKDKPERLVFDFVPHEPQVNSAVALLQQQGEQNVDQDEIGVPLFVAKGGGENAGYLTVEQGEQQAVLMFFNKEDLQSWLDQVKQQDPSIASSVQIEVASLETLIDAMINENEPFLTKIELVPPPESRELVRQELQRAREAN